MTEICYCGKKIEIEENICFDAETGEEHYCIEMQEQYNKKNPYPQATNEGDAL